MIGCRLRLKDYDLADYDLPDYDLQNLNLSLLKGVNFFQDKSIRLLKHRFDIFSQTSDKHFYFLSRSKKQEKIYGGVTAAQHYDQTAATPPVFLKTYDSSF